MGEKPYAKPYGWTKWINNHMISRSTTWLKIKAKGQCQPWAVVDPTIWLNKMGEEPHA